MLLKSLLLFFVGALNLLIGLIVLTRDHKKLQHRLFFLFSFALAGWVIGIGGFLMSNNPSTAFHWAKAYYFFPLVVAAAMPLFSVSFPFNTKLPRKLWITVVFGGLALVIPLLFIPSFVTMRLVYHDWGKEIALNKAHYLLYSVYLLSCFLAGLVHTYYKSVKAKALARAQLRFYFFGFLLTSFFGVYFNLILPWFGNYRLIWLGPLFTNFFVMAIAYSIIRHRLFDVRLAVARSLAYIASLVILASVYGLVVFGVAQKLFGIHFPVGVQVVLSAATGLAGLVFHRLKNFFDKATKRIFYRDAYEPQVLFDEFNKSVVSTIDLSLLLKRAASTIAEHMKCEYCVIGVKDGGSRGYRIVGTQHRVYSDAEINLVRRITPLMKRTVIVTDDLAEGYEELYDILSRNEVFVLARLTSEVNKRKEGLGYIVLGRKKSGNLYTPQDASVIETLANELIIAIQNSLRYEEIENFNETLQQKINDATAQLKLTNKKLKQLNDSKDDFVGMASHQLRTPLTSIKGYVSLVMDGDAGKVNETQQKLLLQAFSSAQKMVYLVADLLNVSRLKTGKFVIERKPTNLATLIQEEMGQLREEAKGRGLALDFDPPANFPILPLDDTKTRQVVMNFLDNAMYYTRKGGHIRVELQELPQSVEFRVVDDGIGVPKDEQHHLFTKFYRAKNAQRARPDGTGLGLYMARKVVVTQGGAIIFNSTEGKGSVFGFSFPKDLPTEPVALPMQTRD